MQDTTDNANFSKPEATGVTSMESNSEIITPTGMEPKFYEAAVKGEIDAFKEKGELIESILTPNKNTILHIHFTRKSASEAFVKEILDMRPALVMKVNAKDETILHIAARYGHSNAVRTIIDRAKALPKDIDEVAAKEKLIRAINDKKDTALHEAVRYNRKEVVEFLTKEDPGYSYCGNSDGETPLYIAVERQYGELVDAILKNSDSPNRNGPNGRTVLHVAVLCGNTEMVRNLLAGTLARQADENGWVPLHLAALHESPDLAEVLLNDDRNTAYMKDNKGRTALHFAALCGRVPVMEKIIKYCPDCSELVDEKGYNALHYTTVKNGEFTYSPSAAKMILENPSLSNLYNEKDANGNTPLHHLAARWSKHDHHPLLERRDLRVDTMAFNKQNQTVLDVAYDNVTSPFADKSEISFLRKLKQIGAMYGGRVINEDTKKKKQEKRQNSAVDKEERDESDPIDTLRKTISVVATLIATVTFAAGFTLPGGTIQEGEHQGSPILKHDAAFKAFTITDSISFFLSASAVLFQIFSALFRRYVLRIYKSLVKVAFALTMVAMVFMTTAFATGTYAVLGASKGLGVVALVIGLSFFFTFIHFFRMVVKEYQMPSKENWSLFVDKEQFYPQISVLAAEEIQLVDI